MSILKVGQVFESNSCGELEVIEYVNARKVRIKFIATGFEKWVQAKGVRSGMIKDLLSPSVYGAGFVGVGGYATSENNKQSTSYKVWQAVIRRCYDKAFHEKAPTYKDCTVCDEWLNFQNFAKWFEDNYIEGYELDKDLLTPNNKHYSPEMCIFVPARVNTLLGDCGSARGEYPQGVSLEKKTGRFKAQCQQGSGSRHIGFFSTVNEAVSAYRKFKKKVILKVAGEQSDKRLIDGLIAHANLLEAP